MKAALRRTRISPKKANLVAGMVRGKKVSEALSLLKFMPKKGAEIIYKVVHSAAHNAKNNFKQKIDDLYITQLLVTKGPTYKRSLPISRGRVHPIRKRTSHITVEVGVLKDETTPQLRSGQAKQLKDETTKRRDDETTKKIEKKEVKNPPLSGAKKTETKKK
ncbi:50S ribosomal protein L22 [Patescibacteria group bacterium]|nr:50S ribosomal protein L22 [Patescibacteria group bacterium]